jgi:hypothetical protein
MNGRSHPNHENCRYEGSLPQGLSGARRGKSGFQGPVIKAAAGRPSGRRHSSQMGVWGSQPPSVIPEEAYFHGKPFSYALVAPLAPAQPPELPNDL